MDLEDYQLFDVPSYWKASEELMLLEAIELYNFGNWEDISLRVPSRTVDEIKQHFIDYYINGNIGFVAWESARKFSINPIRDHTCCCDEQFSQSLATPLIELPGLSNDKSQQLGYMPNRDDFEREYDNDVERLVANLSRQIHDEDDLERDMKLAYIDVYNRRLAERFRRKDIIKRYNLVKLFFDSSYFDNNADLSAETEIYDHLDITQQNGESPKVNSPKSKRNSSVFVSKTSAKMSETLRENLNIFAQFVARFEYEELISNIIKERELKSRIEECARYRRNGLTCLREISAFEACHSNKKSRSTKSQIGRHRKYYLRSQVNNYSVPHNGGCIEDFEEEKSVESCVIESNQSPKIHMKRFRSVHLGPLRSKRRKRKSPSKYC